MTPRRRRSVNERIAIGLRTGALRRPVADDAERMLRDVADLEDALALPPAPEQLRITNGALITIDGVEYRVERVDADGTVHAEPTPPTGSDRERGNDHPSPEGKS